MRDRYLGISWNGDRLKLGLCAIAVWGSGVRSFKIRVVRSRLGMLGVRSFKIGVVSDRHSGISWECDRFQKSVIIEGTSDEKR